MSAAAVMDRTATFGVPPAGESDYAFAAMHQRLLVWGLCWLRGGGNIVDAMHDDAVRVNNKTGDEAIWGSTRTDYREPDPAFERRDWAQPTIEAAKRLHGRVIALSIQRSLVLQAFYFEEDAEFFWELGAEKQWARIRDLTYWTGKPPGVNARIVKHNAEKRDNAPLLAADAFLAVRHRAIRELIARERGIPAV